MKYIVIITGVMIFCLSGYAQQNKISGLSGTNIEKAWDITWKRFYHTKTNLFYDYISSYEKEKELSHLPTQEEVARQYPNPCGYGTGMEDCIILAGVMLSAIVDKYTVTKNDDLKESAWKVFNGIRRCSKISGHPGFVARGICTEDGESFYINSSRDQYTHCAHGLWKLYHSPLSSFRMKEEIRSILTNIAERMYRNCIPENDYDFLRADGERCPLGICRMWNVEPHEAARLPMIYAATFDVTREEKYYRLYRQYIQEAINQSKHITNTYSAYVFLQMQCSFELLHTLENDADIKNRLGALMQRVAKMSVERFNDCYEKLSTMDSQKLSMVGPDWRKLDNWTNQKGYNIPQWGEYRKVWECVREGGETLTAFYMADQKQDSHLDDLISKMDYNQLSGCGIIYHIAAYWKWKKRSD